MRILISILFLITISTNTYCQVISGTIIDEQTKEKVCFASIYFSGTFIGTSSDTLGNFKLNIPENISMPLTISAVGYYSYVFADYRATEPYNIFLKPKIQNIDEVTIKGISLVRKRKMNMKLFKKEFLGKTSNSSSCVIINENDIRFNYNNNDTLFVYASNPILIENKALGYKFTYYLDEFVHIKKSNTTSFQGSIRYTDDLLDENTVLYSKRRKLCYVGSRMHFIRALWTDSLKSNGFIVRNESLKYLRYNDIVFEEDSIFKFISYPGNLTIEHIKTSPAFYVLEFTSNNSNIRFLDELVFFEKNGYFDPYGIEWSGKMGLNRMADLLPYEYLIVENNIIKN